MSQFPLEYRSKEEGKHTVYSVTKRKKKKKKRMSRDQYFFFPAFPIISMTHEGHTISNRICS